MTRKAYKSDLTDAQWRLIEPLIPPAKPGGRRRTVNMREIVNGIFYVLRTGCAWELMPLQKTRDLVDKPLNPGIIGLIDNCVDEGLSTKSWFLVTP